MKWSFKEIRTISAESLRALCIREEWYTNGDNDEYGHLLFDLADRKENITTDDVCEIAQDIINHSDLTAADFEHVAFEVMKIANSWLAKA